VKHRAASRRVLRPNLTVVRFDVSSRDRKSQPHSPLSGGEKRCKDFLELVRRDARSTVEDRHFRRIVYALGRTKTMRWSTDASDIASVASPYAGWLRVETSRLKQHITLVSRPRHFGGRQWFFVCPATGRRATVLLMPPGANRFCSRRSWGRQVAYACSSGSG
jgi:hypothetical protein